VLTPTTFGDDLSIGVTYRIAGFSRQKIDGIMDMFMDQIENPCEMRHDSHSHAKSAAETIAAPHRQPAKAVA